MIEEKVNNQNERNQIDANMIEDTKKSSERKIKENLIDAEELKHPKENINSKQIAQINNNENNIQNTKPQYQKNSHVEIKLNEKVNSNVNNIKNLNNYNLNISNDSREGTCLISCFAICCALFFLLITLTLNFIYAFIFVYYKNHCKECKSELYQKINKILLNYLGLIIICFLIIIISIVIELCKKIKFFIYIILSFFLVITTILSLYFSISNIVIVQKYYNRTTSWESCGNFKGWMKFWLIINYISIFFNFIDSIHKICKNNSENNDN
jgi:uncharacterized protein (DUF983 family)